MKPTRKLLLPVSIAIALLICLVPVKTLRTDRDNIVARPEGTEGTVVYSALLYKIVVWNDMYLKRPFDSAFTPRTGIDFYPFHFGEKEWRLP